MIFKNEQVSDFLLKNGEVYTLRPTQRKRGRDKTIHEPLVSELFTMPFGHGLVTLIKEIKDDTELGEFVSKSGFFSVHEWRANAKDSKFLYHVKLTVDLSGPHP
jgi:hypothetical protein